MRLRRPRRPERTALIEIINAKKRSWPLLGPFFSWLHVAMPGNLIFFWPSGKMTRYFLFPTRTLFSFVGNNLITTRQYVSSHIHHVVSVSLSSWLSSCLFQYVTYVHNTESHQVLFVQRNDFRASRMKFFVVPICPEYKK